MTTGPTPTGPGGPTPPGSRASAPFVDPAAAVAGSTPSTAGATAPVGDPAAGAPPVVDERPDPADSSTSELLRRLTENIQSLVKGEVASARQEMTEKARAAQPAAAMLGGAAVLGVLATGTSAVVLIRFLDKIFPPLTSAVIATGLLGGGAAVLGRAGIEELRRVGPPVPERTIESVKADVAAVTEATPG